MACNSFRVFQEPAINHWRNIRQEVRAQTAFFAICVQSESSGCAYGIKAENIQIKNYAF